jgi:sulfhydrogenase subunit beta (sulfur reductase)
MVTNSQRWVLRRELFMTEIYLSKQAIFAVVEQLMADTRVYGPVFQGQYHEFAALSKAADLDLNYRNTRLSPKALFEPHSEKMFEYCLARDDPQAGIMKEAPKDYAPRVIFGIRPCDARAFQLVDVNFDTPQYRDPWWVQRREATTLVGLACNQPCSACFCTTVGTGPFDPTGLDVMLVDLGTGYLAQACTDKGAKLLAAVTGVAPVPGDAKKQVAALQKAAEASLPIQFQPEQLAGKDMKELFNAPFWDEVQFSCINCGTCTFLCPTCWCFDVQDEVHQEQGSRIRIWDSCMFPLFTFHGSGHNPRAQKLQRVRQRFMHKLKYYVDKYENGVACVGCGRCVQHCPVNIDIRRVAAMMTASCVCPL